MNCRIALTVSALLMFACLAAAEPISIRAGATTGRDERLRRLAVGTWHDEFQGKRTMTLREDGTGTMLVELSGMRARLVAERLTFDMIWSVEQGRLKKRTLGGEPAVPVRWILKTMGDHVDEPILELTDQRLRLQDKDGKTEYDWRRAGPDDEEDS